MTRDPNVKAERAAQKLTDRIVKMLEKFEEQFPSRKIEGLVMCRDGSVSILTRPKP